MDENNSGFDINSYEINSDNANRDEFEDLNALLNSINENSSEKLPSEQDFERARIQRRRERRRKKKSPGKIVIRVLIIILCVLLAILIALGATWLILYKSGESQLKTPSDYAVNIDDDNVSKVEEDGSTIDYNGKLYRLNPDVVSLLFIGIDREELGNENNVVGTGGQADALYLVSINTEQKKYKVISISRDTMTDIGVYSADGKYVGTEKKQICLSYAYGDGKTTSCENTVRAVSSLFYNIPIQSYFALERSAIPTLNDTIGGVTVPVYDEDGKDAGKTTTLFGQDAYDYVHYRDISRLDSNNIRMTRQTAYIKAFIKKLISSAATNLNVALDFFNTATQYSSTNLNTSIVTYYATTVLSGGSDINIDYVKLPGKITKGKSGNAEYNHDKDALTKLVIETYYEEYTLDGVTSAAQSSATKTTQK
ncbi:MAG: LCP family protein [Acutalibacteraceae bacterium]|nr:LCP family protein [Acutalibacteraceae bacterium]